MATILFLALLCGCGARQLRPELSLTGETSVVGCLTPSAEPGRYVLTERDGGRKLEVIGAPELRLHASNHAVRVIGMLHREFPEGLKAIRVEHVAAACKVPF